MNCFKISFNLLNNSYLIAVQNHHHPFRQCTEEYQPNECIQKSHRLVSENVLDSDNHFVASRKIK